MKNAAAHGDLNDTQLEEYNIECQGHTTRMGKKAYNFSREPDRAKTLQHISDMINKKYQIEKNVYNKSTIEEGVEDYEEDINDQHYAKKRKRDENYGVLEDNVIHTKRKISGCDEMLIESHDDWGKKHPLYEIGSLKIKWSPFERDYVKVLYEKNRLKHNVWRHCLDSILNTNDENVRQQFHKSHLKLVKLKDAIRVKKQGAKLNE